MSDPVKTVEDVEDVLSSIRRLVSETSNEPRADADPVEEDTPTAEAPANNALILTSALRINDPAAANAPTDLDSLRKAVSGAYDEPEIDEDTAEPETSNIATWPVNPPEDYYEDEVDTDVTASVQDSAVEWTSDEPDTAEFAESEPENFVFESELAEAEAAEEAQAVEDHAEEAQAQTDEEPWISVGNYEEAEDISEDDAEDMTAFDDTQSDDHDDEHSDEMQSEDEHDHEADDEQDEDHHEANHEGDAHHHSDDHDVDDHSDDEGQIEDEPAMATFMRSGGDAGSDAESAEQSDADLEDATMFATDEDDGDPEPLDLSDLEDAVIDEDMLRDLVAEIVRQELTGAMGERITRNVRKLVRREIHRALAAREFD